MLVFREYFTSQTEYKSDLNSLRRSASSGFAVKQGGFQAQKKSPTTYYGCRAQFCFSNAELAVPVLRKIILFFSPSVITTLFQAGIAHF